MKSNAEFLTHYGPWALIAGASMGIGEAYSRQLAEKGLNLVLLARGKEKLEALAQALTQQYPIKVRTLAIDLAAPDLLAQLKPTISDLEIGLLVYNAA